MKVVVGLGNPGRRYASTRHNMGFWVVDQFVQQVRAVWKLQGAIQIADTMIKGEGFVQKIVLLKPLTYMNLSGRAVCEWLSSQQPLVYDRMCVVHDDVSLPLGRLRLRYRGSSGGHNGLSSILESLGTQDIPRLRIGVGSPAEGVSLTDHVLGGFSPSEQELALAVVSRSVQAVSMWGLAPTAERAMQEINRPVGE
ncbi:aminoacyl-tRNA hydrolase [Pasteuria penetrans]|uniref:aminoacyl-tRNA hydrolase n=1 Tax=Pasteuria penetrans TaxID=86005 RepID=UPI000FAA7AE8|nr:aminoacyl-tRNA hydrolase [Pasteuria penetrans]